MKYCKNSHQNFLELASLLAVSWSIYCGSNWDPLYAPSENMCVYKSILQSQTHRTYSIISDNSQPLNICQTSVLGSVSKHHEPQSTWVRQGPQGQPSVFSLIIKEWLCGNNVLIFKNNYEGGGFMCIS